MIARSTKLADVFLDAAAVGIRMERSPSLDMSSMHACKVALLQLFLLSFFSVIACPQRMVLFKRINILATVKLQERLFCNVDNGELCTLYTLSIGVWSEEVVCKRPPIE